MNGGDFAASVPRGRRVVLRPVLSRDFEPLYLLATTGENGLRWRFRGATPSPDQFGRQLWDTVLAQFVVQRRDTGELLGLVGLYNANLSARQCYAFALAAPTVVGTGRVLEGLILLLEIGFATWDFRKVYFEVPEFNLEQFRSARRYLTEEGRLKEHDYMLGRYWDLVFLSVSKERWTCPDLQRLVRGVSLQPS